MGRNFEKTKWEFWAMIKESGATEVRFEYDSRGNDEFNPCGTQKKTATYELYAIMGGNRYWVIYKFHVRDHDTVCQEVTKRYQHWFDEYHKKPKTERKEPNYIHL